MEANLDIINLYRYFAYAAHMRSLYVREVSEEWLKTLSDDMSFLLAFFFSPPGIYMMYSYAAIYIVIEGWRELKLVDPQIDNLLASPFVDRLRVIRNATFHYQKKPISMKHLQFFGTEEERTEIWLNSLYSEFERFFRENTLPLPNEIKKMLKDKSHAEIARTIKDYWKRLGDGGYLGD